MIFKGKSKFGNSKISIKEDLIKLRYYQIYKAAYDKYGFNNIISSLLYPQCSIKSAEIYLLTAKVCMGITNNIKAWGFLNLSISYKSIKKYNFKIYFNKNGGPPLVGRDF